MLREALQFLIDALLQPFAAVLLFRFHAVWLRAPMRNPLGEFIMAITDFLVLKTRRYVPAAWGYDSASLLLALGFETLYLWLFVWTQGVALETLSPLAFLPWAAVKLIKISLYILIVALIAEAILSWLNKPSPAAPLLAAITQPFLRPLRRVVPVFGAIDLTPMLLFILCQLVLIVPVTLLEQMALSALK